MLRAGDRLACRSRHGSALLPRHRKIISLLINLKNFFAAVTPLFRFSNACAAEKHLISEKPLNKRFFKDTGVALAEHNNRSRLQRIKGGRLWRRGRQKNDVPRKFFARHRNNRKCSPKIRDFRASGIPVGERVGKVDTLK